MLVIATSKVSAETTSDSTQIKTVSEVLIDKNNDGKLDLLGSKVTVTGRATVSSSVLHANSMIIYVQDQLKGVLVYSDELKQEVQKGDSLVVSGTLKLYYGKAEVVADEYQVIETSSNIPPAVSIDKTYENPERYLGTLVQGKAVVVSKQQEEAWKKLEIAPSTSAEKTVSVYIDKGHEKFASFDFDMLSIGDPITVQGILDKYTYQESNKTIYQIIPRSSQDLRYIGVPQRYWQIIIWGGSILAVLIILAIIFLRQQVKSRTAEITSALENNQVLMEEIHHRVKNNLAVISGLLQLESMNWDDNSQIKGVLNESMLRINSIAMIHEQLYQTKDFANLSFDDYVEELVENISTTVNTDGKEISLKVFSNNIKLNVNQAIPCSLIINELVTNAYKHGFDKQAKGELKIKMKQNDKNVSIMVDDDGKGLPKDFDLQESSSLGLSMVQQLTQQLNGDLSIKNGQGACFEINFKIERNSGSASNYFV
ncbi:sensor histidine kinase [Fodinibius halophilus]|uniref:histidine kinase n=1 Tax=Fodinibius halophilus TaxID=1736908 RepID=A0A6M1T6B5_9BACT|nr:sensor histidine kinase [Fodinibius halophilus]NGP86814.1 sensor histidine kinase [Fodinibius halophilus]